MIYIGDYLPCCGVYYLIVRFPEEIGLFRSLGLFEFRCSIGFRLAFRRWICLTIYLVSSIQLGSRDVVGGIRVVDDLFEIDLQLVNGFARTRTYQAFAFFGYFDLAAAFYRLAGRDVLWWRVLYNSRFGFLLR